MEIWPFSRRAKAPKSKSWKTLAVEQMQAWRGIGETFRYLGRECVVTGYFGVYPTPFGIDTRVLLSAEYADDLGVIRYCQFSWQEAKALMESQP